MSVTDEDREKAMQIMAWDPLSYDGLAQAVKEGGDSDDRESLELVDDIAAALAAEREKARAPFHALVAFYDRHEYSTLNVDQVRELLDEP